MAKRIRRKFKKRRGSRKRFTRKRRQARPKYDGMICIKMQASKELVTTEGIPESVDFNVQWGDQISGTTPNIINFTDCPEWIRYRDIYQQFSV